MVLEVLRLTGCPGSGPRGSSTPGYSASTEMYGFEDSYVGTHFLRKQTHSGISVGESVSAPFLIQDQTQFKQLGKVYWGRGLPMLHSNKNQ